MSQMFYGDHNRWFVGLVIDVNDPLKLDRVKVRIQGIHTHDTTLIPNADLPWAQVTIPVTEGGSSGIGANCSIKPRAQVFGFFLDGKNSQLPLVIGSIPKIDLTLIKAEMKTIGFHHLIKNLLLVILI